MKIFLLTLSLVSTVTFAEQSTADKINESGDKAQDSVVSTAKKASSETKKALRKIGRKSMDATCELTKTKTECAAEKAGHDAATKKDDIEGVSPN